MKYRKTILVCLALMLSQCGKKTKSREVEITTTPEKPVVITSDIDVSIGGTTKKIKAPWFKFSVSMKNGATDTELTIVSLHIEVTGTNADGVQETVQVDVDPSQFSYNDAVVGACSYTDFGVFNRGS